MSSQVFLFLAMMICLAYQLSAQKHSLILGGGLKTEHLIDRAYSPLVYTGSSLEGIIGYRNKKEHKERIWMVLFGSNQTSNRFNRNLKTNSIRLHNYTFYTSSNPERGFNWGWSNINGFHHRLIDDFSNFNGRTEFFTTFGPAVRYSLPFEVKSQRFTFQTVTQVQLIGFYLPSAYVASLPGGFGYEKNSFFGAVLGSAYLFYPGSGYNAGIWPSVQWHTKSGNSIMLNYLYEYTQLNKAQESRRSVGSWLLTFLIGL